MDDQWCTLLLNGKYLDIAKQSIIFVTWIASNKFNTKFYQISLPFAVSIAAQNNSNFDQVNQDFFSFSFLSRKCIAFVKKIYIKFYLSVNENNYRSNILKKVNPLRYYFLSFNVMLLQTWETTAFLVSYIIASQVQRSITVRERLVVLRNAECDIITMRRVHPSTNNREQSARTATLQGVTIRNDNLARPLRRRAARRDRVIGLRIHFRRAHR